MGMYDKTMCRNHALVVEVPLLDGVDVRHGPTDELARLFLLATSEAAKLGTSLRLHEGLIGLAEANQMLRTSWGGPLIPILDHTVGPVCTDGGAFWISGHDAQGMMVATQAVRLTDMTGTSLAEELASLRLFYADPAERAAAGAACRLSGTARCAAAAITGRVTYGGGLWCHDSLRGRGMTAILPRIARNLAATLWDVHYHLSIMDQALTAKAVHQRYGYTNRAGHGVLKGMFDHDVSVDLVWMDRVQIATDRVDYIARMSGEAVRTMELDEMKATVRLVPAARQGSSRRS